MRSRYVIATLAWIVVALAVKPFFPYLDFGAFYATAIDKIISGAPLDLYAFIARAPGSDLAFPVTNPPHEFFVLAPWYALGQLFGLDDFHRQTGISLGQAWMLAVTLPLDVLLCRALIALAETPRRIAEPQRFTLYLCLLFSPLLWLSSVRFQHNEAAMVLCVVLAVASGEGRRPVLAGALWGAALALKTTAIVPALAWFGWGLGQGRLRQTTIAAAVGAAVFAVPLLPYLVFRREQVVYALVGFERLRPVGGYVLWKLFPDPAAWAAYGNVLILLLAAATGVALAFARGTSFLAAGGAWALVFGQVALLLFGKAVFVWYGLALSCFLYLAVVVREEAKPGLPLIPLTATCALWLLQAGGWVGESVSADVKLRSALWTVLLLAIGAFAVTAGASAARASSRSTRSSP
jgi:hypothetical protein